MKKYTLYISISFILLLGVGGWYFLHNTSLPVETSNNTSISSEVILQQTIGLHTDEKGERLLNTGDFSGAISYYEEKSKTEDTYENKMLLVYSYLQYGNYAYQEKEYSKKALDILGTMSGDTYDTLYAKGYASELIGNFSGALDQYESGLKVIGLNNEQHSTLLYQIGHTYDLMGQIDNAYKYFRDSYSLNQGNYNASVGIGRYLIRTGKVKEAIPYIQYGLGSHSNVSKAEIYFTLSSIDLELGSLHPNIADAIENAQNAIHTYPDYPMGYVALAKGYYMLHDQSYNTDITNSLEKAIKLNPNGYEAYRIYGLHQFDVGDFTGSLLLLAKARETVDNDVILMNNQRDPIKEKISEDILLLSVVQKLDTNQLIQILETKFTVLPFGKDIIGFQLKRAGYGIFGRIKDDSEFKKFIETTY